MELSGTLGGRYRLDEIVASGGMGTVARGHDEVLNRTVAIKLLLPELAKIPNTVERFQREARIAASLSHPGIAQVFDFGQDDGRPFIVMEHLDGEDLRSVLAREGRIAVSEAVEIVASAAEALDNAHRAGAVHRDIKPGNIFLTRDKVVKITDFGIARLANEAPLTATGTVLGTFAYAPPEQALGENVSPAGDIYSLGCVLFELVVGRPPFEGDSPAAIAMAHVSRPAPSARDTFREVPEQLDAVIAKSLSKDPPDRFASAGEMAVALRTALDPTTIEATVPAIHASEAPTVSLHTEPPTLTLPAGVRPRHRSAARGARIRPVVAVLILAAAILAVILSAGRLGPGSKISLPNWVGQQVDRARVQASELGLVIDSQSSEPSDRPAGEILRQEPPPGTALDRGDSVILILSSGPEDVLVPDVIDLDLEEAQKKLERFGFKASVIGETTPGRGKDGVVVAQDPTPGLLRPKGSTVGLTISRSEKGRHGGDD